VVGVGLERNRVGDKFGEFFVARGEMLHGLLEIERRGAGGFGGFFEHSLGEDRLGQESKKKKPKARV
jgi:hypothetical protein